MKKIFATSIFSFITVMLLLSVIHIGCSSRCLDQNQQSILEQPQENAPEQPQKTVTSAKLKETSIFTVIELEDLEYPTLAASIQLPFRVRPNNTVILSRKHAYLTTKQHLHVIDVSIPQRPVYLSSLVFSGDIGKMLVSGTHIIIAGHQKFHLVDISHPTHPVLQFTTYLPHRNTIEDMDVRDAHLYVLGENDSLYVFSIGFRQARLVKVVELNKRWWLLSPEVETLRVKQLPFPVVDYLNTPFSETLQSQRGFLQLHRSSYGKIRSSSEFLAGTNLFTKHTRLERPPEVLSVYDGSWYITGVHRAPASWLVGLYNIDLKYREYLSVAEKKTFIREKPMVAYAVVSGKMQRIPPEQLSETVEVAGKTLVGPITDFQISGDLLCVVNAKGFFSIIGLVRVDDITVKGIGIPWSDHFLSITPLQLSRPMSLAIGKGYAYVLAAMEDS